MENKSTNQSSVEQDAMIEIHGMKVVLLEKAIQNSMLPDPCDSDLWLVNHTDGWLVRKFLRLVIQSNDIRIHLQPIFLQQELKVNYSRKVDLLEYLSDGYIENLDFLWKLPMIQRVKSYIQKRIDYDKLKKKFDWDRILMQKTFDYYHTRQRDIRPILYPKSHTGYCYPRLEVFFVDPEKAFKESRRLLRKANKNSWLRRHYVDTCHLCNACSGGFLNYREICPKCQSHNLRSRTLIHHFRCAHVAIQQDFIKGDHLICPKCSKELRNLGVDYDKPGQVFKCKGSNCQHEFQNAPVAAYCVNCKTQQPSEELLVKKVYRFEITGEGLEIGLHKGLYED